MRNLPFAYKKGENIIFCPRLILSSGEIYILQGTNGSGKNMFLKLIFGLLKTGGGKIDGVKVRTVAYVHDHNGMYEHLSVSENIKLRLSLYKYGYSSQKMIRSASFQYGLFNYSDKLVKELYMGIKKKVSLICALAVKSDILVLVEHIFTLDNNSKNEPVFLIASYISPSTAVICTSHDGEFINTFPDYNIISFPPGEIV